MRGVVAGDCVAGSGRGGSLNVSDGWAAAGCVLSVVDQREMLWLAGCRRIRR